MQKSYCVPVFLHPLFENQSWKYFGASVPEIESFQDACVFFLNSSWRCKVPTSYLSSSKLPIWPFETGHESKARIILLS